MKLKRPLTVKNIQDKKYNLLQWDGAWYEAFSHPELSGSWFVYGASSNGKTGFNLELAQKLASLGKRVGFLSIEEGSGYTMREAIMRAGWDRFPKRLHLLEPETYSELVARLDRRGSYDVVFIDSIQFWDINTDTYKRLIRKFPEKLFVFVSHVKGVKGTEPRGIVAENIMKLSSLKIWVEGYRAVSKGRYIGPKGYYTIWDKGAQIYWGNND